MLTSSQQQGEDIFYDARDTAEDKIARSNSSKQQGEDIFYDARDTTEDKITRSNSYKELGAIIEKMVNNTPRNTDVNNQKDSKGLNITKKGVGRSI